MRENVVRGRERRAGAARGACYPPPVSDEPWTRLAAPFPASDVVWDVVDVEDGGEDALVVPRLRREALAARLDEACGVAGWSLSYAPFASGAVGCTLEVRDVRKAAVVNALGAGAEATADAAFAAAAGLYGMTAPVEGGRRRVGYDAESGGALHDPEPWPAAEAGGAGELQAADAGAADVASAGPAGALGGPERELSDEARGMIDRLVERLKGEGQGLAAVRLVVRHGGYGKDPEAARALYRELRALLKRVSEEQGGAEA
jgi:hypothetical protein